MPLNRPALTLGSGPSGVQQARRWVVDTCHDIKRDDLVECAEFGVSELVTNAVLHGIPPIKVRVRGTWEHPRVEVIDGSTEPPILPGSETLGEDDDLLLTFGRGLNIVARCATAWGAEIEDDGKVVWFVPASEPSEGEGVVGVVTGVADPVARDGAARRGHARRGARRPAVGVPRLPGALSRAAPRGAAAGAGARVRLPAGQDPVRPVRLPRPGPPRGHPQRGHRVRTGGRRDRDRSAGQHAARDGRSRSVDSSSSWTSRTRSVATSASCRLHGRPSSAGSSSGSSASSCDN